MLSCKHFSKVFVFRSLTDFNNLVKAGIACDCFKIN